MDITDLSPAQLATCARPAEQYAELRKRGVHRRHGEWITARPPDVLAALTSPALAVADPRAAPPVGDAKQLQARMARFSDGPSHGRRRELLEQGLPDATGLDSAAARRTAADVRGRTAVFDVMPLAQSVPVEVLAATLGVPTAQLTHIAALVGRLCDALSPSLDPPPVEPDDADAAARELTAALATAGPGDPEQLAAVAGLLFQARDATAALIGAAVLHDQVADDHDPTAVVDRALRHGAPVQCTRRTAVEDIELGGVTLPRGASLWVILAAAEQGPPSRPATFGAGPHRCPGAAHAVALATGVLTALRTDGWRPVPGQPVHYEPRPNLRLPSTVLIDRA